MTTLDAARGLWRLTVHRRDFSGAATPHTTGVAELTDARSRRLETALNTPGKLTFTMDGRSPSCAYIQELRTDVLAWRWDEAAGADVLMGRFVVAQAEDQATAQAYTVNFTCHTYDAALARRYLTAGADLVFTQRDQDDIVMDLVTRALNITAGAGAPSFWPGSNLPLIVTLVAPDGSGRGRSGLLRDRTYTGGSSIGQLISDLSAVLGADPGSTAYDFDVAPSITGADHLRVFYPVQGVPRTDVVLAYGSTVSGFTRAVNSADFANYQRVIGDNSGAGTGAPQLFADAWTPDANDVSTVPIGLWMDASSASDVNQAATLNEKAHGDLATSSVLVPSYSLNMRPGAFAPGAPNIGDTVPLVIQTGRLNVSGTVRVLGVTYDIGDDDQEDVEITVGRPALTLSSLFQQTARDVAALARR